MDEHVRFRLNSPFLHFPQELEMKMRSLCALSAFAGLALANVGHAAVVPIEQSITLLNPADALVYNIATNGGAASTTSYYELIVSPSWSGTDTKFTTFSTEPVSGLASYALFTDTNAAAGAGNTGAMLQSWSQTDIPGNNLIPFFNFLLTTGQYVLQINTIPGQFSVSTNIAAVPLPGAMWLFGSALLAFLGVSARRKL
jgi:hypothetical protein